MSFPIWNNYMGGGSEGPAGPAGPPGPPGPPSVGSLVYSQNYVKNSNNIDFAWTFGTGIFTLCVIPTDNNIIEFGNNMTGTIISSPSGFVAGSATIDINVFFSTYFDSIIDNVWKVDVTYIVLEVPFTVLIYKVADL